MSAERRTQGDPNNSEQQTLNSERRNRGRDSAPTIPPVGAESLPRFRAVLSSVFCVLTSEFSGLLLRSSACIMLLSSASCVLLSVRCDWLLGRDTTPPMVWLRTPLDSALVGGTVSIQAHATDSSGVSKVEFFLDTVLLGAGSLMGSADDYEYTWNTSGLPLLSTHSIYVRATDIYDNAGYSDTTHVTITAANDIDILHGAVELPPHDTGFARFSAQAGDSLLGDARLLYGGTLTDFFWCDSLSFYNYRHQQNFTPHDRRQNQSDIAVASPVTVAGKYYVVFQNGTSSTRTLWVRFLLRKKS